MEFDVVIGLEVHCQLNTQSKIFASDSTTFGVNPNTNVSVLTLAHPGVMPKLNKEVVASAVKLGVALGCEINQTNYFERKNYFYPDLPKGYQITQDKQPVCVGGSVKFWLKKGRGFQEHEVQIHHIHMEEDAGKSIHGEGESLLDYNRAGAPLLEIVSHPCIKSPEEAAGYLGEIRKIVRFLGISDGNMEEGSLRADLNVSLKPKGDETLGTKVEIKNMNSMRFLQRAAEYEIERQTAVLVSGGKVLQETRSFVPETGKTVGMREKETANDYRYFPEPDLAPVIISDVELEFTKENTPMLPYELFGTLVDKFALSEEQAYLLSEERDLVTYFFDSSKVTSNHRAVANWLLGSVKAYLNDNRTSLVDFPILPAKLAELVDEIEVGNVSNTAAQKLMELLIITPEVSVISLAESNGLLQNKDTGSLGVLVDEVIAKHEAKVIEFKKGKKGLLGMFVGEVMKLSGGSADPKEVNRIMLEKLT